MDRAQYLRDAGWARQLFGWRDPAWQPCDCDGCDGNHNWRWFHEAHAYRLQRARDRRMLRARGYQYFDGRWCRYVPEIDRDIERTFHQAVAIERKKDKELQP